MKKKIFWVYLKNILLPCLIYSLITGIITGAIVVVYKYLANQVINLSGKLYEILRLNPIYILVAVIAITAIAFLMRLVHKYAPDSKGGGIPNAMAYLRGLVTFKWLRTLIGALFNSLFTFFIGTPLGNEGPCVLAGTTIGHGVIQTIGKKNKAWNRYMMTGGASAGFASATNAPISGILLALEEAHHRLSPMILMVAGATVTFSVITVNQLSPLLGLDPSLFSHLAPMVLEIKDLWLPTVIGIFAGLFSVFFINYFKLIRKAIQAKMKNHGKLLMPLIIFLFSLIFGVISSKFIGTGHHLVEELLTDHSTAVFALLCILVIRLLLTTAGSSTGITGGMFIPTLAFGALLSAIIAKILIGLELIDYSYYQVIILLGMTACFSGMTKTPLTAIVFAFEALTLSSNVISVAIVAIIPYILTEIFCPKSVNDEIMEIRVEEENHGKEVELVDAVVEIQPKSFAVGKQIRDILWPNNLFVLSIKRSDSRPEVNEHGEKNMYPGDVLHLRYSTTDKKQTMQELIAIVGEQDYAENKWEE